MTCHDWMSSKHVTIGTKTGKILILEEAELRSTVDVYKLMQDQGIDGSTHLQMNLRMHF